MPRRRTKKLTPMQRACGRDPLKDRSFPIDAAPLPTSVNGIERVGAYSMLEGVTFLNDEDSKRGLSDTTIEAIAGQLGEAFRFCSGTASERYVMVNEGDREYLVHIANMGAVCAPRRHNDYNLSSATRDLADSNVPIYDPAVDKI